MTIDNIMEMRLYGDDAAGIINDHTEIFIRKELLGHTQTIAHGNWYQDDVMAHKEDEVKSFTWKDDNEIWIDVR